MTNVIVKHVERISNVFGHVKGSIGKCVHDGKNNIKGTRAVEIGLSYNWLKSSVKLVSVECYR